MKRKNAEKNELSRRDFVRSCAAGTAGLAAGSLWGLAPATKGAVSGPATLAYSLDHDWMFGGRVQEGEAARAGATAFETVTLPHCVAKLSWQGWNADDWQAVWQYRRQFSTPAEFAGRRVFLKFDGVMEVAELTVNGTAMPVHRGGYLPFEYELTKLLKSDGNILDLRVDARWISVPPAGSPKGMPACDYFIPGGIIRGVSVYSVPQVFLSDVFAKPVDVLSPERRVEIRCTVDAAGVEFDSLHVESKLMDRGGVVASARQNFAVSAAGKTEVLLTLNGLNAVKLWDVDAPHLYDVVTTLFANGKLVHDYRTRIGFRDASFTADGFFLNGKKMQFFGLNRHEIYPYVGYAMPPRVMRRDAEIIRKELNCNIVRCSHYPQTEAFLDACDELGLMVWQEPPGWQFIGDADFKDQVVENVGDMIRRDRNHASIVIWGVRVNESADDQPLYRRTTALAKSLDDSRPTSGSMTHTNNWQTDWHEDVFALDDYHQSPDGTVQIKEPLPGIPYMLAETVGQYTYTAPGFNNRYYRGLLADVRRDCVVCV
jgi:beta-galactosidase